MTDSGLFAPRQHRELPSTRKASRSIDGRIYKNDTDSDLDLLCARVLGTPDGQKLLNYLRNLTMNMAYDEAVNVNSLLHKEGQRWLVGLLVQRTAKGNQS